MSRLVSTFQYQVQVTSGERYYGSLAEPDEEGYLKVVGSGGTHSLPLSDVFWLGPLERGFWRKLTGSVNFGFSYTESNHAVQYSLSADSQYLGRQVSGDLQLNSIFNTQEDADSVSNQSRPSARPTSSPACLDAAARREGGRRRTAVPFQSGAMGLTCFRPGKRPKS